jgi:hypothetical protein
MFMGQSRPLPQGGAMNKVVPSIYRTAIEPCNIAIDTDNPPYCAIPDTLGTREYEVVGVCFVLKSQEVGFWVGYLYGERAVPNGICSDMVSCNLLYEKHLCGFWVYGLSPFAIEQIYVRQTRRVIHHLVSEVRSTYGGSLPQHLCTLVAPELVSA